MKISETLCETCGKERNTKKATIRVWTLRKWIEETIEMCDECVKSENAKVFEVSKKILKKAS